MEAERRRQNEDGYTIEQEHAGPETYTTYSENGCEAAIIVEFNSMNDVVIYTDSFRRWHKPYNELVSDFDFVKIRNRTISYFECWGGTVTTDDRKLQTSEDLKQQLEAEGIEYVELGEGVIQYSMNAEEFRKKERM